MECKNCQYWNGIKCTDSANYVSIHDNEPMCRYNSNAVLKVSLDDIETKIREYSILKVIPTSTLVLVDPKILSKAIYELIT